MHPFIIFTVTSLAVTYAVAAQSSQDNSTPPAPLIFYNLTRAEFSSKLLEHRSKRFLSKRRPYNNYERENDSFQQQAIDTCSRICEERNPILRATSAICRKQKSSRYIAVTCRDTYSYDRVKLHGACELNYVCDTIRVKNFLGHEVSMAYCRNEVEVNERAGTSTDGIPIYEGHSTIPAATENEPPHSPSALDSLDSMWEIEDGAIPGLLVAQWDYHARYSNGNSFAAGSLGFAHSWSCIGCPAGTLSIQSVGIKVTAIGSIFF